MELTLHGDRTVKAVAKELGLPDWQLYEWRKWYAPRPGDGGPPPQTMEEAEKEISRLRSEVIRMREREVVLKKSLEHPLRNTRERYAQIEAMKGEHPVRLWCELLGVAPSGYYRHRQPRPGLASVRMRPWRCKLPRPTAPAAAPIDR